MRITGAAVIGAAISLAAHTAAKDEPFIERDENGTVPYDARKKPKSRNHSRPASKPKRKYAIKGCRP